LAVVSAACWANTLKEAINRPSASIQIGFISVKFVLWLDRSKIRDLSLRVICNGKNK
jgi:hypothetical protein